MVFAVLLSPSAVGGELVNDLICWVDYMLLGFWGRVTSGALSGGSGEDKDSVLKGSIYNRWVFVYIFAKILSSPLLQVQMVIFTATKYCQALSQTSKESLSSFRAGQSFVKLHIYLCMQ